MNTTEGRSRPRLNHSADTKKLRRYFIGGSDARIIMGNDEAALLRLWREKRGVVAPEDLAGNLVVQLGVATESGSYRCSVPAPAPDTALDGGDAGRPG